MAKKYIMAFFHSFLSKFLLICSYVLYALKIVQFGYPSFPILTENKISY